MESCDRRIGAKGAIISAAISFAGADVVILFVTANIVHD